jgi:hypothetical protein
VRPLEAWAAVLVASVAVLGAAQVAEPLAAVLAAPEVASVWVEASVVGPVVATAASAAMLVVVLAVATPVLGAVSVWVEAPLVDPAVALASGAVLASGLVVATASQVVSVEALA